MSPDNTWKKQTFSKFKFLKGLTVWIAIQVSGLVAIAKELGIVEFVGFSKDALASMAEARRKTRPSHTVRLLGLRKVSVTSMQFSTTFRFHVHTLHLQAMVAAIIAGLEPNGAVDARPSDGTLAMLIVNVIHVEIVNIRYILGAKVF